MIITENIKKPVKEEETMTRYFLKHKDVILAQFELFRKDIISASINKNATDHLPLPLKRIIHNQEEFVSSETRDSFLLNEEGCYLFDLWLSDREVPVNRDNYNQYVKKGSTSRQWMLENNAFSFTDCYWICEVEQNLTWEDIKAKLKTVDEFYSVKDSARMYKGHNSTLGGELEKFWYKSDGILKLCKKVGKPYDILNAREVLASLIYKKQGYKNYCNYQFVYDTTFDVIGCNCKAFTNEDTELITAYDLLEEHNATQQSNLYELIVKYASSYGLETQDVSNHLDMQILVDYLITNRDRHQGNIGFLRDANTLKLLSPAPVYDSGSSKHLEGEYPENVCNTTVNGLYSTEEECLKHVRNIFAINISKLPSIDEVKSIFDECKYISTARKEKLLQLYNEKVEHLSFLQEQVREKLSFDTELTR